MRILYHHRTRGEDAQGIHIRALCDAFRRLGHEVNVVGPLRGFHGSGGRKRATHGPNSLLGVTLPHWLYELLAIGYNLPAFGVLMAWLLTRRPALLYERYALFNISGRVAAAVCRVPFVLEVNAPLCDEMKTHGGLAFERLARALELWLCRSSTRTVVVSGVMRDIFVAKGCPPSRLMVIPNGVDRRHFCPSVDGRAVRQKLGLDNAVVVGFVGWIRPWHGVEALIDAVAGLVAAFPAVHLMLVGDGPAVPDLKEQASRLGLAKHVLFTGAVPVTEVPYYIAAMDVAVQPDVTEYASPIKLFEYLAMGRAVVAPAKPNIREIVTHTEDAMLFEPGDVEALRNCLGQLLDKPDLRSVLARRAAKVVENRGYFWEANAAAVLAIVEPSITAADSAGPRLGRGAH